MGQIEIAEFSIICVFAREIPNFATEFRDRISRNSRPNLLCVLDCDRICCAFWTARVSEIARICCRVYRRVAKKSPMGQIEIAEFSIICVFAREIRSR